MAERSTNSSPSRRPRISREFLEQHRRRRCVDATAELLHEFPRQELSVSTIVRMAGMARNSFYEMFRSVDDCIAYGVDLAAEELFQALEEQDGGGEWLDEVQDAIAGFYGAVVADPILAELFLIHASACQVDSAAAVSQAGPERFAGLLRRGRVEGEARDHSPPPALAEEYLSRAIVSLAAQRVRRIEVEALPEESRGMAALVGGFYLSRGPSSGSSTVRWVS
jgi:AcrR family transcriptional regulator